MSESQTKKPAKGSIRRPVLLGLFTGTAVGAGYLLAGVPNVELMSLLVALAGGALGARFGAACGAIAAVLYSLGSPFGAPVPLLLGAQAAGFAWVGIVGSRLAGGGAGGAAAKNRIRTVVRCALAGVVATTGFEILTNLAILASFDLEPRIVWVGAVPFFLIHCGVNLALFGTLVPVLLPRLRGLADSPLRGGTAVVAVAVCLLLGLNFGNAVAQDAVADSTSSPSVSTEPVVPGTNWQRPLWVPFLGTLTEELLHRSPFLPVTDGGLGAPALVLGAGTGRPLFTLDGIPLGTGHALADDPALIPLQGAEADYDLYGPDGWGGSSGSINLRVHDPEPDQAISSYRGRKGPHETYLRGISLLTPRAEWRVGFDFDESLDNEGYNWTDLAPEAFDPDNILVGHAKIRSSRFALTRRLDEDSRVTLHYLSGRKTRNTLPVWGVEHQEIWDVGMGLRAEGRSAAWRWDLRTFWNDRDVKWGDRADFAAGTGEDLRLIETALEGSSLRLEHALAGGQVRLLARLAEWKLYDTGGDGFAASAIDLRGDGRQSRLGAGWRRELGSVAIDFEAGWNSDDRLDGTVDWIATLAPSVQKAGWTWRAGIAGDGRAPRSDEWLTPVARNLDGRRIELLPNRDLQREKQVRGWCGGEGRVLGLDLAAEAGWSHLRDGIAWEAVDVDPDIGIWRNALDLDAQRISASVARQGTLWGVYRVRLESTWQSFSQTGARATALPPERFDRLQIAWENHLFSEDGIFQMLWMTTRRGEMDDPWDVTHQEILPDLMLHDLILGFRLVGAHLSYAFRNVTDQRATLATGVLTPGREGEMRLRWIFRH